MLMKQERDSLTLLIDNMPSDFQAAVEALLSL
jgi:hypothetical protein